MGRDGAAPTDCAEHLHSGTTLALYMSVNSAADVQRRLLSKGCRSDLEVKVVASADRPEMRIVETTLGKLDKVAATIENPAIIFIRNNKTATKSTVYQRNLA